MATELELKQIEEKIQEKRNELNILIKKSNDLRVKLFFERKGLKLGQPFMCRGKKIIRVCSGSFSCFNGFYITKKGVLTEKPMSICIEDEIIPLPME